MAKGLTWTVEDADHMTQAEIYGEVLTQLATQNEKIVCLTADLASSTKTGKFQKAHPERFINFGIAEMNMMGAASGLASTGYLPVVATFAVFASLRCMEFVRTDICYQARNVKIIGTHSGTSFGQGGTTHHCIEDLAVMRALPGMVVIAPADSYETAKAVTAAIEHEGPVYIRIGRSFEPPLHKNVDFAFTIGKAIELHQGTDITVIACGRLVLGALEAAEMAARQGLSVRVLDMHTVKPIDTEAVMKAVVDTRRIITVEDHTTIGGLGSAVADVIAASGKGCVLKKLGLQDQFSMVGYPDDLPHHYGMDADGVVNAIGEVMKTDFEADEDWEDEV